MRRALSRHWTLLLVSLLGALVLVIPALADASNTNTWNDVIKLVVWNIVSQIGGFFVWAGGGMLDFTIRQFIVDYGVMFQSWGLGVAVNNLWTVARDLFNLTFIFALVYIGFRMILDSDDSGAKKAIVNLVIAALLVNFSLFFTKAIVDFSNITATQVANVLYANNPNGSISGTFAQTMGLASLWGDGGRSAGAITSTEISSYTWAYIIGTLILCLVAAFAFMAGAAILTIRFIVLTFFMVISPIMFIGKVFPFLKSKESDFWNTFLKNAFFAPAFLLMLYFSLYVLSSMRGRIASGGLHNNLGAGASNVNDVALLLLVGGFLLGSVIIGQRMGAVGSSAAINIGNNLRGRAQGLLGRGAIRATGLNKLDKALEKRGFTERSMLRALPMAARNAKFGSSYSAKGVDDDVSKGKATAARFTATKKVKDAVNAYKKEPSEKNKIAMEQAIAGASSDQINEVLGDLSGDDRKLVVAQLSNSQFEGAMKAKDEVFSDSDKSDIAGERQTATRQALIDRSRTAASAKASTEAYQASRRGGGTHEQATAAAKAAAARETSRKTTDADFTDGFTRATLDELHTLGEDIVFENAGLLTIKQVEDIKKDDKKFTPTQKDRILGKWKQLLVERFMDPDQNYANADKIFKTSDENVSKLPKEILTDKIAVPRLTISMLNKIKGTLDPADRRIIRGQILNPTNGFNPKPEVVNWFQNNPNQSSEF